MQKINLVTLSKACTASNSIILSIYFMSAGKRPQKERPFVTP